MAKARRQCRATCRPVSAAFTRGMAAAYAALYSTTPLSPEQVATQYRALERAPYVHRQHELPLSLVEPDA